MKQIHPVIQDNKMNYSLSMLHIWKTRIHFPKKTDDILLEK